mmetsp:Transcript_122907/g.333794  ORF Transcript_122907/g.333794 Transcript_122907/m.333794 type:complete len:233 (-) Transcript_122907:115-813(-)
MPVDRRLSVLHGRHAVRVGAVHAVQHLEVHLELRLHDVEDETPEALLQALPDALRQPAQEVEVQVADRDSDLVLVEPLEDVLVDVRDDGRAVREHELAAALRGGLEAAEAAELGGLDRGGLVVQADDVARQRGLVDGLVDCVLLLLHRPQARGVDRVQARVQLQLLEELAETRGVLRRLEVAEPDGAVFLELLQDLVLLLGEILPLALSLEVTPHLVRVPEQRACVRGLLQC